MLRVKFMCKGFLVLFIVLFLTIGINFNFSQIVEAATSTVELNIQYVLENNYMGGAIEWEASQNYDLSDEEWNRVTARTDFLNLGWVRCMTSAYWYCTGFDVNGNPTFDFTKQYVSRVCKVLDYCQSKGIDVLLGEWNEPNTEALNDYTLGSEKGPNDIIRNYDINAGDIRWAKAIAGFADYLINTRGYTCIKYYDYGNEPNLSFSSYNNWKTGIQNLYTEFGNKGLNSQVTIVGPDGGFWVDSWLAKSVNDLGTQVGTYDLHYYVWRYELEKGVVEENMRGVKKLISNTYPDRKLFLGEVGMYDGLNIENEQVNVREYWYGVSMANSAVQCMRAGLAGLAAWNIDDLIHINGIKPLNDYKIKLWGLWNSKGTEFGIPKDENLRPYYYTLSLISKFFPKGSSIIYSQDSGIPGVFTAAMKKSNGSNYDISVIVVNDSDNSNTVKIKIPNATNNPTMKKYVYFSNDMPIDNNGYPSPKETLTNIDLTSGYDIVLPSRGVVILTTMNGGTSMSLNTGYQNLKTPNNFTNLAAEKTVTASNEDTYWGNYAANAVDGDYDSVWSPGPNDPNWLQVDLGSQQTFNTVELVWRDQFAESYKIQVSDDAVNWTDVYTTYDGTGTYDIIRFPAVTKRYVRMYNNASSGNWGCTLREIKVYNNTTISPPVNPIPTALTNLALSESASASSGTPSYAFDGTATTYWTSSKSYPQWVTVDLATSQAINRVKIKWMDGAKSYKVQTSTDGDNWTDQFVTNNGKDGYGDIGSKIDNIYFSNTNARYVRVYMYEPSNFINYSILELEVYNDISAITTTSWDNSGKPQDLPLYFEDHLKDWSYVYSHSNNIGSDSSYYKKIFEYDDSRIKRTTNTTENVIYKVNNFNNVKIRVYGYNGVEDKIKLYTSPDGTTWSEVKAEHDTVVEMTSGWYRTDYSIVGTAPSGANFLKIEMYNDSAVYSPQIGRVRMYYNADFIDDINDTNKMYSYTNNLRLDGSNASYIDGDAGRITRTGSDVSQSIVYRMKDISSFSALIYGYNGVDNKVKFYTSTDNSTWTEISTYHDTPINTGSSWYKAYFRPQYYIPFGTNFLKIELYNDAAIWSPQLGQVAINKVNPQLTTDYLNNFQKTYYNSANWALDSSNALVAFEGDYSRIKRTTNTSENIVYKVKNDLTTFKVKVYGYGNVDNKVKFYTSSDGNTWSEISSSHDTPVSTGSGWYRANFSPSSSVPSGTNYLKIEFYNDANIFSPQLSEVDLTSLNSIEDDCKDWMTTYQNTSDWALDGGNASCFEGDITRFKRVANTPQSLIYKSLYDMVTFNAKIFAQSSVDNKVNFYTSPDCNTWTQISSTHDTPVSTGSGWYRANFTPTSALPVGTRYLKIEFTNDTTIYSPQLSSISIPYKYKYLGKTVWIKSTANNKYVTTQTGKTNAPLEATSTSVGTNQQYVIEDAGEGYIALKAVANGKYLSVSTDTLSPLQAKSDTIGIYEKFWATDAGSGYYALHALVNDMYVSMNDGDSNDALQVNAKTMQSTEKYQLGE